MSLPGKIILARKWAMLVGLVNILHPQKWRWNNPSFANITGGKFYVLIRREEVGQMRECIQPTHVQLINTYTGYL